ncbi:MAG: alanine--tRNA ligase [Candidatus Thermoplasmatota archaeon]|nr:alanine--tRNA ligase [Candidatus Thermoplasmatota archaeon]
MAESTMQKEYDLQFFHTNGYYRKKCKACGDYFWTLDAHTDYCGDQPCVKFNFIGNSLAKKPLSLADVREGFLSFFEEHGHSRLHYPETGQRCPVVARWRSDIYLTIASIADFQPHVTSGVVPPPANPLVISQPCIRLNDLEEVGKSGRHLTTFEMMGHHAFNKNTDEIYWKEDTVAYCDEFFRKKIGIPREAINYKEQLWIGGGNAGPCVEVLAGGLEIATLVFMNMKEDEQGSTIIEGKQYAPNPLNIVDTGYGLERIAWFTTGTPTVYETAFPKMLSFLRDEVKNTTETASIYALADHTKCLSFMLGDGIVPANVKAGYLARLIIRRSLRFIEKLQLNVSLRNLVEQQLDYLKKEFPSLEKRKDQICEILDIETRRFSDTLSKGEGLIKRILREKQTIDPSALIMLYDTHGMPPDVVQNIAQKENIPVSIPPNFDSMIAELHSHEKIEEETQESRTDLPATHPLYYDDHYIKEFDATILWKQTTSRGTEVILDKTAFYPEGGGQPADKGTLRIDGKTLPVLHVEKAGTSIIHVLDSPVDGGTLAHGSIDWDHRYTLMKHHTGTHVVNGALRRLFGEHIWQAGSQLAVTEARFDFAHYKPIAETEIQKIEQVANDFIIQAVPVEKKVMKRNDAEREHGFRLYQGGVPPGNLIRVLNIPGVDVEACGGTHLNNTKEIEKVRILKTERIADGVNRITFAAGKMADAYQREETALYHRITSLLSPVYIITHQENIAEQLREAGKIFSVSAEQLEKTLQRFLHEAGSLKKTTMPTLLDACNHLFNEWKNTQKQKKLVSSDVIGQLTRDSSLVPGTSLRIITGRCDTDAITVVGTLIKDPGYIVHISDGKKLVSGASEDVDIDLRPLASEIGRILGGSGGGKPKLTQCGGPYKEKITEALTLAKKLTIKKIKKQ